ILQGRPWQRADQLRGLRPRSRFGQWALRSVKRRRGRRDEHVLRKIENALQIGYRGGPVLLLELLTGIVQELLDLSVWLVGARPSFLARLRLGKDRLRLCARSRSCEQEDRTSHPACAGKRWPTVHEEMLRQRPSTAPWAVSQFPTRDGW